MSLNLSPKARMRLSWMDTYRECGNAAQVCRHFSIPLRTFWRWRRRYNPWDLLSLEDKSKKPKNSPFCTSKIIELSVLKLKQEHPRWGKEKLGFYLNKLNIKVSASTCYRICKRKSRIIKYHTRKRKIAKPRINWAEVHSPGDLFQVDTKFISYHGQRLFQYTCIDVVSRWRYAEIKYSNTMKDTIDFLNQARNQLPLKLKIIQTDNGKEFGRQVSHWCQERHIRHVFSHKRRPQENAYVERSHRIDEEEFYSIESQGPTLADFKTKFANYLKMYNYQRPHWGLQGKTPIEVLNFYLNKPCHIS